MIILPSRRIVSAPPAPSSLLTGLTAYWKLDEASGTRVDATANANDLTAVNNPGTGTGPDGNTCLSVASASSQEVKATNSSGLKWSGGDFSVSRWVKYTTLQSFPPSIISMGAINHTSGFGVFYIGAREGNDFIFNVTNGAASAESNAIFSAVPATGQWHLLIGVYDSATRVATIYRDNVAGGSGAALPSDPTSANVDFSLGGGLGVGYFLNGLLAQAGYWSKKLSSTERTTLYGGGTPPTYPWTGLP